MHVLILSFLSSRCDVLSLVALQVSLAASEGRRHPRLCRYVVELHRIPRGWRLGVKDEIPNLRTCAEVLFLPTCLPFLPKTLLSSAAVASSRKDSRKHSQLPFFNFCERKYGLIVQHKKLPFLLLYRRFKFFYCMILIKYKIFEKLSCQIEALSS